MTLQVSAQSNTQKWLTNYETALATAERLDQPIFAFVTDGTDSSELKLLEQELFESETFRSLTGKVTFLKMDANSANMDVKRHAIHFTKSKSVPAIGLIDYQMEMTGAPLNKITSENISAFLSFLEEKFN